MTEWPTLHEQARAMCERRKAVCAICGNVADCGQVSGRGHVCEPCIDKQEAERQARLKKVCPKCGGITSARICEKCGHCSRRLGTSCADLYPDDLAAPGLYAEAEHEHVVYEEPDDWRTP